MCTMYINGYLDCCWSCSALCIS